MIYGFMTRVHDFTGLGLKEFIAGIGTLFATFIGAWLAFQFAKAQRDRERAEKEIAAGNRALYTLTAIFNQTYQHQEDIVAPIRGRDDAWLNMAATSPLTENVGFDLTDLSFVLQAKPEVFSQVLLEEQRFKLLAHMISEHASLMLNIVWPRLETAGIGMGELRPDEYVKNTLGPGIVRRLERGSAAIIKNTDDNVEFIKVAFGRLRSTLKELYPDRLFVDFKFKETRPAAASDGSTA